MQAFKGASAAIEFGILALEFGFEFGEVHRHEQLVSRGGKWFPREWLFGPTSIGFRERP